MKLEKTGEMKLRSFSRLMVWDTIDPEWQFTREAISQNLLKSN